MRWKFSLRIFFRRKRSGGREPGSGGLGSPKLSTFLRHAKELVALDGGNHADGAFFARLGALHAAEAADAYRSGQSDLIGRVRRISTGEPSLTSLERKK